MAHALRFQVGILPDLEWPTLLDRFRHVEALGFDVVGTGDQFADSMDPSRPWFDLWTLLAAVAQATPVFETIATEVIPALRQSHGPSK